MNLNFDETLAASVFSSFKNMSRLSYNSVCSLEANESLSVSGQSHLNALKFCALQTNRLCNVANFLMQPDNSDDEQRLETFEIENLLQEITNRFCSTVSAYSPVVATCHVNLKNTISIIVNKSRFELVFLNLLYCCLKKRPGSKASPLKLSIYVTENAESVIFHIRDNSPNLSPEIISNAFSEGNLPLNDFSDQSFTTLVSLSLRVAQKAAKQLNAHINYTPLKTGNRFDLSLPKFVPAAKNKFYSLVPYIPTYRYYDETFADIQLEFYLQKIIDSFDGLEDFWV